MDVSLAVIATTDGQFTTSQFAIHRTVSGKVDVSHGVERACVVGFDGHILKLHGH